MLYKFKSRAAADLIMLAPQAHRVLEIVGKSTEDEHGIITVAEMPAAIAALQTAAAQDEQRRRASHEEPHPAANGPRGEDAEESTAEQTEHVHLSQRIAPFVDLLKRSAAEGKDVIW